MAEADRDLRLVHGREQFAGDFDRLAWRHAHRAGVDRQGGVRLLVDEDGCGQQFVGNEPGGRIGTLRGSLKVEGVKVSDAGIRLP